MKRLCIYLIFDKENIIDRYILYMLQELRTCSSYILVVNNSQYIENGKEKLENYADKVICRDNIGFDAGGFKEALCSYLGWDKVFEYDELILVNDSIFGPFKPMKNIFSEMDNSKADFWGLATHGKRGNVFLEHIQTYFLVVRSRMLHSVQFKNYWERMPFYATFLDVVYEHEVKFTAYFKELGYTYDVLADMKVNDSKVNPKNNYIQYATISYELIKKRNFPFLKRQQLAYDTLHQQTQENLYQAIDYIDRETDYDVNLIWDNIIRTMNIADLQRSLHLQYIISSDQKRLAVKKRVAIVIFAEHEGAAEYVWDCLKNLKEKVGYFIQIISDRDEVLQCYEKYGISAKEMFSKQDFIWEGLVQYDYVCVLHDTDMSSDIHPSCKGKSYFYSIWENLLKDENHILGILEKFEKEERLGFLAPPKPNFADYFGELGDGWNNQYDVIKKLVNKLKLNCQITKNIPPFRVSDNFWIRGNILKCCRDIGKEEFPCLSYIWSYCAQHMGYYSGVIESSDYASMNEVNMQYYLNKIITQVKCEYGDFKYFNELREKILIGALKLFCEKYSRILIYGMGYYAKKYKDLLSNVEACIVSDDQNKVDYFEGIPVKYLSEIENLEECGIVLCLNEDNQKQVIPNLEECGIKNYFSIPC